MSSTDQLHYLQLTELSALIQAGEISPVEATEAQLARVAALDGDLGSYAVVLAESAREQASHAQAEIASGRWRGPLHGVPVALKDLVDLAGVPTRAGMPLRADAVAGSTRRWRGGCWRRGQWSSAS